MIYTIPFIGITGRRCTAAQPYRMFYNMVGGTLFVDSVPKVKRLAYTLSTAGYDYRQDSLYVGDFTGFDTIVDEKERIERIDTFAIKKVPTAVSVPYGKGEVIFVSSPLLFTNYGMLEGNTFVYIFRLMSYLADLPVYERRRMSRPMPCLWRSNLHSGSSSSAHHCDGLFILRCWVSFSL